MRAKNGYLEGAPTLLAQAVEHLTADEIRFRLRAIRGTELGRAKRLRRGQIIRCSTKLEPILDDHRLPGRRSVTGLGRRDDAGGRRRNDLGSRRRHDVGSRRRNRRMKKNFKLMRPRRSFSRNRIDVMRKPLIAKKTFTPVLPEIIGTMRTATNEPG